MIRVLVPSDLVYLKNGEFIMFEEIWDLFLNSRTDFDFILEGIK